LLGGWLIGWWLAHYLANWVGACWLSGCLAGWRTDYLGGPGDLGIWLVIWLAAYITIWLAGKLSGWQFD